MDLLEHIVNAILMTVFQTLAKMVDHAMMELMTTIVIVRANLWEKIVKSRITHVKLKTVNVRMEASVKRELLHLA